MGDRRDIIFAFMPGQGSAEAESLLLVKSIRQFGGRWRNNPIWVMIPNRIETLSPLTRQSLEAFEARLLPFEVKAETLAFLYGGKVVAAAAAETLAEDQTDLLVWMDSDTVFLKEPAEFFLKDGENLGCCPVMLKNISSLSEEPLNPFWEKVFKGCRTLPENIFSLETLVDAVRIRAQFNAGMLAVRPEKALLRSWRDDFLRLYQLPHWEPYFLENFLYKIFIHQAILAGTILARLKPSEIHYFSRRVNYPLFLHDRYPLEHRPPGLNGLTSFRYDAYTFFKNTNWLAILPSDEPLKLWLNRNIPPLEKQRVESPGIFLT
ncbi:MAG: hypothetical protein AB1585_15820 [Thermodesulfobacteriota bacterium]